MASFREGAGGGLKLWLLSGRGAGGGLKSGLLSGRGAGGGHLPHPLGYGRNSISHVNQFKLYNDTINGKLGLCENRPRFHQIVSNRRPKI